MVGRAVVAKAQTDASNQRRHRHVLQAQRPEVVAILATGTKPAEVARLYGVAVSTVTRFAEKYAEPIAALREEVVRQVEDYAIASKVNRIAALDKLYRLMDTETDEYGLMVTEVDYHYDKEGKETGRTETRDFRGALVKEIRGVLKDAADELGQIPRPDVHNTVNVGILVRQVAGYNPEDIG